MVGYRPIGGPRGLGETERDVGIIFATKWSMAASTSRWPARVGGRASRSLRLSLPRPVPEAVEIGVVSDRRRRRGRAFEHQITKALPIRVGADQRADIFTGCAVSASDDLLVDEGFQRIRERDVHRAHGQE